MRIALCVLGSLAFITGCNTSVRPNVNVGTAPPPGMMPGGRLGRPDAERGVPDEAQPLIDEVCRTQAMRSGWIAIRYLKGGENCPAPTDADNPYNAAVIERYNLKPVGATMVICADQPIPRDWVREYNEDVRATCEGARVRDGAPTVVTIRRVASRR